MTAPTGFRLRNLSLIGAAGNWEQIFREPFTRMKNGEHQYQLLSSCCDGYVLENKRRLVMTFLLVYEMALTRFLRQSTARIDRKRRADDAYTRVKTNAEKILEREGSFEKKFDNLFSCFWKMANWCVFKSISYSLVSRAETDKGQFLGRMRIDR